MDSVNLQEIPRYLWVVNNNTDVTLLQSINDGRNVSGALFLRPTEPSIIGARLQNHDMSSVRNNAIDTVQHVGGGIRDDAGIGDCSIDAALSEDGLQSCREGSLYANTPTYCVAGANRNNGERAGMTGPDPKDEHNHCRKSARAALRGRAAHLAMGSR